VTIGIRPVEPRDEGRWRTLFEAYLRFYQREPTNEVTSFTWQRLLDPAGSVRAIVAEDSEAGVVGIANYLTHETTWALGPVCYLQDLFVDPAWRAGGVGAALIDWLVAAMAANGWSRLYWLTREDNYRARGLYDKYNRQSGFLRYVVEAGQPGRAGDPPAR
jgi:GNAT superfamily N-acetyltransferase